MANSAGRAMKNGHFDDSVWYIPIGRFEISVNFKDKIITNLKDGKIVDKFNYEKNYSLMDFGLYIDKVIESENQLNEFSNGNRQE